MSKEAKVVPGGLTLKEEKVVQLFMQNGEQSKSFAEVYGHDASLPWVRSAASRFFKKDVIKARVQELISKTVEAARYSSDDAMKEAKVAYDLAERLGAPAAMVSAVTLRAKLAGHLIEKREVTNKTVKDMTREEAEVEARRAASELGWTPPPLSTKH